VAAITLEVDGQHSGAFGKWDEYSDFLITHARWLLGGDTPDDIYLKLERDGQDAVVTVELDPDRPAKMTGDAPTLSYLAPAEDREQAVDLPFQWTGPNSLQARFKLARTGTYRTLVKMGGRNIVRGPAVTLPYSPEFMPRVGLPEGRQVLSAISELTGGRERVNVLEALTDRPRSARMTSLLPWLLSLGVVLLLLEIAGRRLGLWSKLSEAMILAGQEEAARVAGAQDGAGRRARDRQPVPSTRDKRQSQVIPATTTAQAMPVPPAAESSSATSIFEQAKRRARKRLNE
jgi:hypothetical protein